MTDFIILTDSSCDLDAAKADELGLAVVPLTVHFKGAEYANYLDGREITNETFYQGIKDGEMPSTSAVSVGSWMELAGTFLEQGRDVLILAFSSGLSNTYNAAQLAVGELAEKYPDRKVYAVDTLCASLGQGMMVNLAVAEKRRGQTIDQVRDFVENKKLHIAHWVKVEDLSYLRRGGRVSSTSAFIGSLLGIKPIIHMNDEGALEVVSKGRGAKAAYNIIADKMAELIEESEGKDLYICHSHCREEAEQFGELLVERFGFNQPYINYIGPVIGAHVGIGTVAVFFESRGR